MADWVTNKEKSSFREIVLEHLKEILKITRVEFRGGYNEKKVVSGVVEETYIPDSRKQYIQSIESLSDILLPYFDKKMEKTYKEIKTATRRILKKYEDSKKGMGTEEHNLYIITKLRLMRKLFQQLNLLLNRQNYLKSTIYGEEPDEENIVDMDQ